MHVVPPFIIPLITARMASRLIVDSDAFTHQEQEEIKALLRRVDAKCIAHLHRHPSRTPG